MNPFDVRRGASGTELWCEGVPLGGVADSVGTPFYAYSTAALVERFTAFRDAFDPPPALVAYAVKANPSLAVLRTLARLGAGADTVSEGEIRRALAAGVDPQSLVFSGVGKPVAGRRVGGGGTVLHVHARASGRRFLVLDAGMNDLVRPAMYDAHHAVVPVRRSATDAEEAVYDIVGPVCETSDTFARQRRTPVLAAGDLVALLTAGAYGASMAGEYNSRPLVPEVMIHGDRWALTRPRPSYDEMLGRERLADWL